MEWIKGQDVESTDNQDPWVTRLTVEQAVRDAAIAELRALLVRGLTKSLSIRYGGGIQVEDVADTSEPSSDNPQVRGENYRRPQGECAGRDPDGAAAHPSDIVDVLKPTLENSRNRRPCRKGYNCEAAGDTKHL